MSTLEVRLKDPAYKNWVKTGLCLALVKEGLEEYAEIKSKEFHDAILASVAKIQTYQTAICDNERITFDNNNNGKIACNHAFCQGFLNEVVNLGIDPTQKFKIRKANIENCVVKLWPTDHWELAKLFMNQGQKPCQTNPSQTDLSGILNFLEHCQVPRNGIQNVQHIDQLRQTRNSIMHTPDMKVSPDMFQTDTQSMLDLLRDPNLSKLLSAKHAESEIQKVIQADFQILLEGEITVIKNWMTVNETKIRELRKELTSMQQTGDDERKTLQTQIQQMEEEIKKIADSLAGLTQRVSDDKTLKEKNGLEVENLHGSVKQAKEDLWNAHNELKRQVEKIEQDVAQERKVSYDRHVKLELKTSASISALSSGECELKRRQEDIEERMALYDRQTKMESQVEAIKSPTIGDEDCRKLRESLVKEYSRLYKDISLSPFGEELNDDALRVPINETYCDLDIVRIKGNRQSELETESDSDNEFSYESDYEALYSLTGNTRRLKSYSEMFADTEIKNIVIKGEGGTGKSTWCKRLLHAWCQVQRRELGMEGASDEASSDMEESLKRFDYLFYVTLRHVKCQSPLKDIFLSTGIDRLAIKKKICELILANNSENVLILLDGFDEYPFTLDCQGLGHSTIIMTTRPWKYDVLSQDNNFKVDAVSEIRGLTYEGVEELSRKVIVSYTKQYPAMGLKSSNEDELTKVYLNDIKSAELWNSIEIPLILIITVLTWLENNKSLSKSLTCNILGLLKVIFLRGENKLSETHKKALKRAERKKKEPSSVHEGLTAQYKFMCDNQVLLQHLGRLAYKGLTDKKKGLSLVFSEDELHEFLDSEELEICYKLGLLTGSTVTTSLLDPPQVSISFYHKLIQELFAAIGIISSSDNLSKFKKVLTSLTYVREMENVIVFVTVLNPCIGSDLSKHIAGLAETDDKLCKFRRERKGQHDITLDNYSKLIFKCMLEWDSAIGSKEQKQLYLTDLIIESDFDRKLHLCTYLSGKQLKSLTVKMGSSALVNIKQVLSQLTKLTAQATPLQFLDMDLHWIMQKDINATAPTNFDLTESVHLQEVSIQGQSLSNGQHCLSLTFGKTVQLGIMEIQNAIINTLYLRNITRLKLINVELKKIRLPTILEQLRDVRLQSVTMPESSWNSFFQCLQSPSLIRLTLKNLDIDDITINLENNSELRRLELEDVKVREIKLPTRLWQLKQVRLQSVTMPESSWNSFFHSLQSLSLTGLTLENLDIANITINLENSSGLVCLELEDVKVREIKLPTRLEQLKQVRLQSVTMPESSWNSFFQCLQSPSLIWLTLKNLDNDNITINLENNSEPWRLELEDVKVREIKLPTRLEKLEQVRLQSVTMPESSWNSFFQCLQSPSLIRLTLKNLDIDDITINLENNSELRRLELEDVKVREIKLPTRLWQLKQVRLQSVTMPESSWNSFFHSLQSLSLTGLTLENLDIANITINLENSSGLVCLELEDVKVREIKLPTRLEQLKQVRLQSVTMPESSWNSFFQCLQSPSLIWLTLKNLDIDDITINLENDSELWRLELEDVKVREIKLPTRLEQLREVRLQSVTMPESSRNSFFHSLQSPSLTVLTLKNLDIDKIRLLNCKRLEHLGISNMKLEEKHISSTESLKIIEVDEVAFPESQASSFFNQVLLSTKLTQLTMKNINLGEETVQFDRWSPDLQPYTRYLEKHFFKIQLENVTMSLESYECLFTLLKTLEVCENQVTKHSIDIGFINVTVFFEEELHFVHIKFQNMRTNVS